MIITIDIGNTATSFSFFVKDKTFRAIAENIDINNAQDYHIFVSKFIKTKNHSLNETKKIIICSVVKTRTVLVKKAFSKYLNIEIVYFDYKKAKNIKLAIDNPKTLGTDMIATALGATDFYPQADIIVIDCGTATTISLISAKKEFLSYSILPGVKLQFKALASETDALPKIDAKYVKDYFGKNTKEAMLSGVVFGHGLAINAFVKEIKDFFPKVKVIVTGGFATEVKKVFDFKYVCRPNLIHEGLYLVK